eukprot:GDKJ01046249.1.p1 GENE.GDKJ01046249.1~~GDKJ01046249.1.p1  ORF type:complete len:1761 (+),score=394.74 GDKJ01046249.1:91-5283(+)
MINSSFFFEELSFLECAKAKNCAQRDFAKFVSYEHGLKSTPIPVFPDLHLSPPTLRLLQLRSALSFFPSISQKIHLGVTSMFFKLPPPDISPFEYGFLAYEAISRYHKLIFPEPSYLVVSDDLFDARQTNFFLDDFSILCNSNTEIIKNYLLETIIEKGVGNVFSTEFLSQLTWTEVSISWNRACLETSAKQLKNSIIREYGKFFDRFIFSTSLKGPQRSELFEESLKRIYGSSLTFVPRSSSGIVEMEPHGSDIWDFYHSILSGSGEAEKEIRAKYEETILLLKNEMILITGTFDMKGKSLEDVEMTYEKTALSIWSTHKSNFIEKILLAPLRFRFYLAPMYGTFFFVDNKSKKIDIKTIFKSVQYPTFRVPVESVLRDPSSRRDTLVTLSQSEWTVLDNLEMCRDFVTSCMIPYFQGLTKRIKISVQDLSSCLSEFQFDLIEEHDSEETTDANVCSHAFSRVEVESAKILRNRETTTSNPPLLSRTLYSRLAAILLEAQFASQKFGPSTGARKKYLPVFETITSPSDSNKWLVTSTPVFRSSYLATAQSVHNGGVVCLLMDQIHRRHSCALWAREMDRVEKELVGDRFWGEFYEQYDSTFLSACESSEAAYLDDPGVPKSPTSSSRHFWINLQRELTWTALSKEKRLKHQASIAVEASPGAVLDKRSARNGFILRDFEKSDEGEQEKRRAARMILESFISKAYVFAQNLKALEKDVLAQLEKRKKRKKHQFADSSFPSPPSLSASTGDGDKKKQDENDSSDSSDEEDTENPNNKDDEHDKTTSMSAEVLSNCITDMKSSPQQFGRSLLRWNLFLFNQPSPSSKADDMTNLALHVDSVVVLLKFLRDKIVASKKDQGDRQKFQALFQGNDLDFQGVSFKVFLSEILPTSAALPQSESPILTSDEILMLSELITSPNPDFSKLVDSVESSLPDGSFYPVADYFVHQFLSDQYFGKFLKRFSSSIFDACSYHYAKILSQYFESQLLPHYQHLDTSLTLFSLPLVSSKLHSAMPSLLEVLEGERKAIESFIAPHQHNIYAKINAGEICIPNLNSKNFAALSINCKHLKLTSFSEFREFNQEIQTEHLKKLNFNFIRTLKSASQAFRLQIAFTLHDFVKLSVANEDASKHLHRLLPTQQGGHQQQPLLMYSKFTQNAFNDFLKGLSTVNIFTYEAARNFEFRSAGILLTLFSELLLSKFSPSTSKVDPVLPSLMDIFTQILFEFEGNVSRSISKFHKFEAMMNSLKRQLLSLIESASVDIQSPTWGLFLSAFDSYLCLTAQIIQFDDFTSRTIEENLNELHAKCTQELHRTTSQKGYSVLLEERISLVRNSQPAVDPQVHPADQKDDQTLPDGSSSDKETAQNGHRQLWSTSTIIIVSVASLLLVLGGLIWYLICRRRRSRDSKPLIPLTTHFTFSQVRASVELLKDSQNDSQASLRVASPTSPTLSPNSPPQNNRRSLSKLLSFSSSPTSCLDALLPHVNSSSRTLASPLLFNSTNHILSSSPAQALIVARKTEAYTNRVFDLESKLTAPATLSSLTLNQKPHNPSARKTTSGSRDTATQQHEDSSCSVDVSVSAATLLTPAGVQSPPASSPLAPPMDAGSSGGGDKGRKSKKQHAVHFFDFSSSNTNSSSKESSDLLPAESNKQHIGDGVEDCQRESKSLVSSSPSRISLPSLQQPHQQQKSNRKHIRTNSRKTRVEAQIPPHINPKTGLLVTQAHQILKTTSELVDEKMM